MNDANEIVVRTKTSSPSTVEDAISVIPLLEAQIERSRSTEEVNRIRAEIETVMAYIENMLPKRGADRQQTFNTAILAAKTYIKASSKAGELWGIVRERIARGRPTDNANDRLNFQSAGFTSHMDATRCVRASDIDDQDLKIYFEECYANLRMPTLNGINRIWKMLQEENATVDDDDNNNDEFLDLLNDIVKQSDKLFHLANTREIKDVVDDVSKKLRSIYKIRNGQE